MIGMKDVVLDEEQVESKWAFFVHKRPEVWVGLRHCGDKVCYSWPREGMKRIEAFFMSERALPNTKWGTAKLH